MNFLTLISIWISQSHGWGGDIHRKITEDALKSPTMSRVGRKYLTSHLGSDERTIIRESTWADSDEATAKYPGSDDLHFSNTPWRACAPFEISRDCGFEGSGQCIVTGIADMVMIAIDPNRSTDERIDALKFVIHLVADIHQPLHTGFIKDNGGCNILLETDPKMSLHQMWDYGLVDHTVASEVAQSDLIVPLPSTIDGRETLIEYASALATESSTLFTCDVAYRDEAGEYIVSKSTLSPEYIASRRIVAIERIATAGQRLAQLINLMAVSFSLNRSHRAPVIPTQLPNPVSTNRYEILDMEFEPDEIVDKFTEFIAAPPREKRAAEQQPATETDGWDTLSPDTSQIHVGAANLDDVVLIKSNEAYWFTCREILRRDPRYIPLGGILFRVRFLRNRRRTEPIMFFTDAVCFGSSHPVTRAEFLTILNHISGNRDSKTVASELTDQVVSATRRSHTDVLDIAPMRWEAVKTLSEGLSVGRYIRGWTVLYKDNPAPVLGYVEHLRNSHMDIITAQVQRALVINKTIGDIWEREFYSKFASIKGHQYRNMVIYIHSNTLNDPDLYEMRFTMTRGVHSDGDEMISLIDTRIFDGLLTPKIHKGLWAIANKGQSYSNFPNRPTFKRELHDIWTVLSDQGNNRLKSLKAIKGYFMYPSMLSPRTAYIEWTTKAFVLTNATTRSSTLTNH